jgi:Kef-type K+ transport system membrane component KefB/nucleotide-binding universal stress UspA family protein
MFSLSIIPTHGEEHLVIFFTQIALLLLVGRLLGEWMQRRGQPTVLGQLLAGIILGPSFFGAVWPQAHHLIFPAASSERQMLSAVSELGVMLLLLLTGMETDLALVKRVRRAAAITSTAGIVFPFLCGFILGEFIPASILPDPQRRFLTSLFLATALSISSVKIVAVVLQEVDFLRRNLGQIILAAAILDDTVGWTILALISGLAAKGKILLGPALLSVLGTAAFLLLCLTVGIRWVAKLIRWSNDNFVSEMAVISVILIVMIASALATSFIGVHTVLGAFVAGIMVGQSPILTKHIQQQLRGLIVALFMPVFFGVAGLSIDLKVLTNPGLVELSLVLILIASIGKLGGCFLGSRFAGLNNQEALSLGFAMNARGSTEVILATIGLSMGLLNQQLYTIIVFMAVATTLCMPPLLRWALARAPMREEELHRMQTEAAEARDLLPKIERLLVGVDTSPAGRTIARFAGWLIGARRLTATLIHLVSAQTEAEPSLSRTLFDAAESAKTNLELLERNRSSGSDQSDPMKAAAGAPAITERLAVKDLVTLLPVHADESARQEELARAILAEAANGYGLLLLGVNAQARTGARRFPPCIEQMVLDFAGPVGLLLYCPGAASAESSSLKRILVPTTGADYSRFGAEVAVAIAKGCGASLTSLHISAPASSRREGSEPLQRSPQALQAGRALLSDIAELGEREGVRVFAKTLVSNAKEDAILRQAQKGEHDLIVIGTKAWTRGQLHFGHSASAIIQNSPCPILIVKS